MLFFIGMPGSGKSYWGQQAAVWGGWNRVETDGRVEADAGCSIADYFHKYGAAAFRQQEARVLQQIIAAAPEKTIVSCGGGTPCFFDNLSRMKQAGKVIYLRADVDWLYQNLAEEWHLRPLFQNHPDPKNYLAALLDERRFFYEQADVITDARTFSLSTFAQILDSLCINPH
jgi:shikimate kinase